MRNYRIVLLSVLAVVFFTLLPQALAKKKIDPSDLPAKIKQITQDLFPGATVTRAKIVDDHGEYDVYGELPDSSPFRIDFNDWKIERAEVTLAKKAFPKAIVNQLKKLSPGSTIKKAKKAFKGNNRATYEIEVQTAEGNKDIYSFDQRMVMSQSTQTMTLDELPKSVREAIEKKLPGSSIVGATKKTVYDKVLYDLEITSANNTHIRWEFPSI